jgi:hypothetical protein
MTEYQVVAEMASHVEVLVVGGVKEIHTFYKGAVLPDGVPTARVEHLLSVGVIAPVGEVPLAPNAAVKQDPATGANSVSTERLQGQSDAEIEAGRKAQAEVEEKSKADAEVDEKRAAAKAKLPTDGSAPDGRASEPVMVEWLATKGYDYDELVKQDKAELKALVASVK